MTLWILLFASLALNAFLIYAWRHDDRLRRKSIAKYEQAYHDMIDYHFGNPPGTTKKRLVEGWPEGSELRAKGEKEYRERYGEEAQ